MKDVGVREFRDHASTYLCGDEPFAVRRHGRLLGFYVPVKRQSDAEELRAALREARDEARRRGSGPGNLPRGVDIEEQGARTDESAGFDG